MLGYAAGLDRDAQRIREAYARVDRSPMGTTVLNGTSWPLNRKRMADYLGFAALVDNAYDAAQIIWRDEPLGFHEQRFALVEAISHLERLAATGRAVEHRRARWRPPQAASRSGR